MAEEVPEIRREFARAWGRVGSSWGVAPSTASVQGYLLLHGGPLTEAEIRRALGLSPRATRLALAECEAWGIVERAAHTRRSGRRGPAGTAWLPVSDHWEWFRRVVAERKRREADPAFEILERCLSDASAASVHGPEARELTARIESLLAFVHAFDRGVSAVVRTDTPALAKAADVLMRVEPDVLDRLMSALDDLDPQDVADAARVASRVSNRNKRTILRLATRPGFVRLILALSGPQPRSH
jgi:DNA-binding transcriptional regulator GbsR (MarR family)